MPAVKRLPADDKLRRLRLQGWTQKEVAENYGVSESAVWKALQRAGYNDPVPTYRDLIPWKIAEEHKATAIMERFRSIVKQKKGAPLRSDEEYHLTKWLRELEANDLVVNYHPDAPPNSASTKGGFYYVPRDPEQDKWIIREPPESLS